MDDLTALWPFLTSLAIGLLLGLERERRPGTHAGLRTFALTSVAGTAAALVAQQTGATWLLPALLLALAAMMIAADHRGGPDSAGPDTTTTVALIATALFGAMLWHGSTRLTVALALATTALLYFKAELHDVTHRLSRQDMVQILQFGAITFVVLPVLPDQGYGPYGALNPHEIWLMVVLVAGVGLGGYVALRLGGASRSPLVLGVLGGLVSSTATTLVFARRVHSGADDADTAQLVIQTASLMLLARLALIVAVVAPGALPAIAPMLGCAFAGGAVVPLLHLRRRGAGTPAPRPGLANPVELGSALAFGAIYAVAVLLTAWLDDHAGRLGVYAAAPVVGATDMDATALSTLKLFRSGSLQAREVAIALALALAASQCGKVAITAFAGGRALALRVAVGLAPLLAGMAAGVWLAT